MDSFQLRELWKISKKRKFTFFFATHAHSFWAICRHKQKTENNGSNLRKKHKCELFSSYCVFFMLIYPVHHSIQPLKHESYVDYGCEKREMYRPNYETIATRTRRNVISFSHNFHSSRTHTRSVSLLIYKIGSIFISGTPRNFSEYGAITWRFGASAKKAHVNVFIGVDPCVIFTKSFSREGPQGCTSGFEPT